MSTPPPDPAQHRPPAHQAPPPYQAPPAYQVQPAAPPYSYPVAPYGAPPAPGKRPVKVWDVVLTIVFLVALTLLAALMSFFGFFLAMASDPCGALECNTDLIATGMLTAVVLPWVFLGIALVISIVLLVRRRLAFWVPLVAGPFVIASWVIGAAIAGSGVPS